MPQKRDPFEEIAATLHKEAAWAGKAPRQVPPTQLCGRLRLT
jgi:hypothetical protein